MTKIIKREIRNYLKRPWFWLGVLLVIFGTFQNLEPYLKIHYIAPEEKLETDLPKGSYKGDISEGYVPTSREQRREMWDQEMKEIFLKEYQMNDEEAQAVIDEMEDMDIEEACRYLEENYQFYGAIYTYEDTAWHLGTREEINEYLKEKTEDRPFSWYFSRKFADFAGLYTEFFAVVMLAALFYRDTRKNTYELLHTKPVSPAAYVTGKVLGGFLVCGLVLGLLNLIFWLACLLRTRGSGFEVRLTDFLLSTVLYILPNMLMMVCVYALISVLFKNPLPAAPLLILYMLYSNMGSRNAEGLFGFYGRPLAIMVRFPGRFFETSLPPMVVPNQMFLLAASLVIILICVRIWKRRRIS